MKFVVRASYRKSWQKLSGKLKEKAKNSLILFANTPTHILLQNHGLKGKRIGYRSINVTGDYRIIFRELSDGSYELVELVQVGTHSQLYG